MQAGFTFLQDVFVVNAREILYEYVSCTSTKRIGKMHVQ